MSVETITITATTENPKPLEITDSEGHSSKTDEGDAAFTTTVCPGDTVNWLIEGDITAIVHLSPEPGSYSVFSEGPYKNEDGSWTGIINSDIKEETTESYSITYTVLDKEGEYIEDPKIEVKPT